MYRHGDKTAVKVLHNVLEHPHRPHFTSQKRTKMPIHSHLTSPSLVCHRQLIHVPTAINAFF